jgi:hypothetical protein
MKRTILISLAAGIAIVPALLGVAAASTNSPSRADDSRSATPSATSTLDDKGAGGHRADDSSAAAGSPTSSVSSDDQGRGSDDATASSSVSASDRDGRDSDDATASSSVSAEDRDGRGSDDATTSSPTRSATAPTTSRSSASSTVDDKGHGIEAGDDSGGHGGKK